MIETRLGNCLCLRTQTKVGESVTPRILMLSENWITESAILTDMVFNR